MTDIAARLNQVKQRIRDAEQAAGRQVGSVQLLAVSKTQPVEVIRASINIGQLCFGESYAQEAVAKIQQLANVPGIEWHFIGPIQSNKTASLAKYFDWIHSVDRLKIAQRLNDQRPADKAALNICIQVNTSGEISKSGISPDQLAELAQQIRQLPRLRLRGLMTIPARKDDTEQQRLPFRQLRELFETLNAQGLQLDTLSMGMTDDMEAAIQEGASIVRIGTALFGPRRK
jgi:pyridoxal phosphate enzyme (YggS family)